MPTNWLTNRTQWNKEPYTPTSHPQMGSRTWRRQSPRHSRVSPMHSEWGISTNEEEEPLYIMISRPQNFQRGLPGCKTALMTAVHSLSSKKSGGFRLGKANFIPFVKSNGKDVWWKMCVGWHAMILIYIGVLKTMTQNQNLTRKFEFSVSSTSLFLKG